jgi:two-component system osmolarity sensor histidine kinase EnvZ
MARTLFSRLAWLLVGVLAAMALLTLLLTRELLRDAALTSTSRYAEIALAAADEVLADASPAHAQAQLHELGIERAAQPPAPARHLFAWRRGLQQRMGERHPGRTVITTEQPQPMLWIADANGSGWSGIPLSDLRVSLLRGTAAVLLAALLVVALAAAFAARGIVRPLARLADAAPAIATGGQRRRCPSAPREVALLADALERAAAQTRETARERELMLAGISHDLRTPLARSDSR